LCKGDCRPNQAGIERRIILQDLAYISALLPEIRNEICRNSRSLDHRLSTADVRIRDYHVRHAAESQPSLGQAAPRPRQFDSHNTARQRNLQVRLGPGAPPKIVLARPWSVSGEVVFKFGDS